MTTKELQRLLDRGYEGLFHGMNPWWMGEKIPKLLQFQRWALKPVMEGIHNGPAPATVLRGPRQVGKTTVMLQAIQTLLDEGVAPHRIFRVNFDELQGAHSLLNPLLQMTQWYADTILQKSLNRSDMDGEGCYLFFDELQNLPDWAPQLKHLVDVHPVRVMVTGSSALQIAAGRDSLAGRVFTIEMGPLLLREIAAIKGIGEIEPFMRPNGLSPLKQKDTWRALADFGMKHKELRDAAFTRFSERGAYPVAHVGEDMPLERLADFVDEMVIQRVIKHDLKAPHREERLVAELFRFCCRYAGHAPNEPAYHAELFLALKEDYRWQRILTYLDYLEQTLLVRLIEPVDMRLKKKMGGMKICLCDHTLRENWLGEVIPLAPATLAQVPHLSDLAGRIAESVAGAFFSSIINLNVNHFPERPGEPEVDFVLTVGDQRIPIEIKYRRTIEHRDTAGLCYFMEKAHYNAPFGIMVTLTDEPASDDPRIVSMPLSTLLLMR